MKNRIGLVVVVLAALVTLGFMQQQTQGAPRSNPPARMQLVGFTAATFNGGQGVLTYASACQVSFIDSRICTSVEIINGTSIPVTPTEQAAWVVPVIREVTEIPGIGENYVEDVSGARRPWFETLSCFGWSRITQEGDPAPPKGLVMGTQSGKFGTRVCTDQLVVACCAPV